MPAEHPARAWGKEGGRVTVFSACGGAGGRLRVLEQGRLFRPYTLPSPLHIRSPSLLSLLLTRRALSTSQENRALAGCQPK